MDTQHEDRRRHESPAPWWRSRSALVAAGFLAVAGYFLVAEHRVHLVGALPWLLLLACPLMHFFMHSGHGGHGHGGHRHGGHRHGGHGHGGHGHGDKSDGRPT